MSCSPAFWASAVIASGLMSGEPTIFSAFSCDFTSDFPFADKTIEPIPKAIRTTPAAMPPHSSTRLIFSSDLAGTPAYGPLASARPTGR